MALEAPNPPTSFLDVINASKKPRHPGMSSSGAQSENLVRLRDLDQKFAEFESRVRPERAKTTMLWYRNSYAKFREFLLEGIALAPAVFAERMVALEEWMIWHRIRGLTSIGVNNYYRGLRTFFNHLEAQHAFVNPYRKVKAPRFQMPPPKALPADDCQRILATAASFPSWSPFLRARALAILGVMLYAGLRRSEVPRLLLSDIDLAEGTIRVRLGKGLHGGKTRLAEIGPDLRLILDFYLRERRKIGVDAPDFFLSIRGGPIQAPTIVQIARRVSAAAGVRFSPHVLRHSFVTHLLKAGVPLYVVKDLAGHSNISSTMIYTRVFSEDRKRGIERLKFG